MSVDLSMVGLQGQQAFATRMATMAQAESMQASAAAQRQETSYNERMAALAEEAGKAFRGTVTGENSAPDFSVNGSDAQPEDVASPIDRMARVFITGGAPEMGMKLLDQASQIEKRESDILNDAVTSENKKLDTILKGADIVGRKLGKARNESEWAQGLREVEAAGIIEPHLMEQIKAMPYDPDVAAYFAEQAVSVADKARMDIQQRGQDLTARSAEVAARQRQRALELQEIRDSNTERYRANLLKAGGKSSAIPAPNSDAVKSVQAMLKNTIYKGVPTDGESKAGFDSATTYIASQAQQIVRDNKAIDWATAVNQAITKAQASGAFKDIPGSDGFFGFGSTPDRKDFSMPSTGKSADQPLAMPAGIKSATDAAKALKKGAWYNTVRGPAMWNGKAWEQ